MSQGRYRAYPEYKDSGIEWLDQIPEGWKLCPLKYLANIKNGQDYKHVEAEYGFPVIGSGGQFTYACKFVYDKESVLLGRKGTIDKPLYINEPFWTVDTMYYTEIELRACAKFVYYLALTIQFNKFSTNTALPSMTQEHLGNYVFAIPSNLAEQTQIAKFLDHETAKIDRLIEKQEALIRLLKEKRQAVISHAVTKGLNPDAPTKDSGIEWLGRVPAHWKTLRIKFASTFVTSGPRGWSERLGDNGSLFIQSGDLNDQLGIEFSTAKRVIAGNDAETNRTRLLAGDVVVCITGAKTGNVAVAEVVPEKAFINQHLCLVRPNHRSRPAFLGAFLKGQTGLTYFDLSQYGLKQGLSLEDVKEAPIVLPPPEEQSVIVEYINDQTDKFDSIIQESRKAATLLQERRTALISAAVTGKIDVRDLAHRGRI